MEGCFIYFDKFLGCNVLYTPLIVTPPPATMKEHDKIGRCEQIFIDLENLLTPREYEKAAEYLVKLTDESRSISELKSGLVITHAFINHPILKEPRARLAELLEKKHKEKLN